MSFAALLLSVYSDMHLTHLHLQFGVVWAIKISFEQSIKHLLKFVHVFCTIIYMYRNQAYSKATLLCLVSIISTAVLSKDTLHCEISC